MEASGGVTKEDYDKLMAISQKAMATAEEANTKAEAQAEVKKGVKEDASEAGYQLTEEQAAMIAATTIAQLEQRGAFAGQSTTEPPVTGGDGAEVPGEPPVPAANTGAEVPPPAPPIGEETPPKKKSIAERFQGKH